MLRVADNVLGPYFEQIPDLLEEKKSLGRRFESSRGHP
jgi:hypothetical protein